MSNGHDDLTAHRSENDSSLRLRTIPNHIAFVCDGNSRWAERRGLPAAIGHATGADRVIDILQVLKDTGVRVCTLYGFSTENWKRSEAEIKAILSVMESSAKQLSERAIRENVRVRILGDIEDDRLPESLVKTLVKLESDTKDSASHSTRGGEDLKLTVCIAVNYGGRQDIVRACREVVRLASTTGNISPQDVDEELVSSCLSTRRLPDPDLIVRTGGESRLSNFLLWNAAYAELYFTDTLWPEFGEKELKDALLWYGQRSRRFGGRQACHVNGDPVSSQID